MTPEEQLARRRFTIIQLVRLTGVAMVFAGLLAIAGRIGLPREAGYVLFVVGLFDAMLLPVLLTRNWKSPRP